MDQPLTSASKQQRLAKAALRASHIHFVAVDFTCDALRDRLTEAGLDARLRTLFLWEGVVYYLPESAVRQTLQVISGACRGSALVFDYVMDDCIAHPQEHYGAAEFFKYVAGKREPIRFGIAPRSVPAFLRLYEYTVQSDVGPRELSDWYLVKVDGAAWGPICDIFRIVHAVHE